MKATLQDFSSCYGYKSLHVIIYIYIAGKYFVVQFRLDFHLKDSPDAPLPHPTKKKKKKKKKSTYIQQRKEEEL